MAAGMSDATEAEAALTARVQALADEARFLEGRVELARRQLADDQEYARKEAETALRFYVRDDVRVIQLRRFSNASGNPCTEWVAATDHPSQGYFSRRT